LALAVFSLYAIGVNEWWAVLVAVGCNLAFAVVGYFWWRFIGQPAAEVAARGPSAQKYGKVGRPSQTISLVPLVATTMKAKSSPLVSPGTGSEEADDNERSRLI
jgi:hypothetical protein